MQFDNVYTIEKEHSKKDFLRKVLIELASSSDTAADVVNANFGEVKESTKEILVCSAHVETDYSASVGYDRKEEYYVKEKKKDYSTGREYYVDVKKTRTVTDWTPFSGHTSGDVTRAVLNDNTGRNLTLENLAIDAIKTAKSEHVSEVGNAEVNLSSLDSAKQSCKFAVECSAKFPGDHHKSESYSSNIEVTNLGCFIVPFYEVVFTYKGKKYHACGFACGSSIKLIVEFPKSNINVVAIATNDTAKSRKTMQFCWIAFAALFVLSCIMLAVKICWTWVFPVAMLILSIIMHVKSDNAYTNRLIDLTTNNVSHKKKELEKALIKGGYKSLSTSEFDVNKKSSAFVKDNTRKGPKVPAILCSIALVILIIVSLVVGKQAKYNKLHSAEQFDFAVVSKTEEYDQDAYYYSNGCYYIHLTYEISAEDIGAKSVSLKVYVYEDEQQIGYITSSLDNMNLSKGQTEKYTVTLSESQLDRNDFFKKLYNAELTNLRFDFEVQGITFDDGKYHTF